MSPQGIWRVEVDGVARLAVGAVEAGPERLLGAQTTIAAALGHGGGGLAGLLHESTPAPVPPGARVLAPVDRQPVWAAGVTYERSRDGRLEESGGADHYAKVYDAPRPELFFKSMPDDVRGPRHTITIRADSEWNVPEPELGLVITAEGGIDGFVLGNDVSSRSIEGENPLYLPQAKVYDGSCALGPCLVPVAQAPTLGSIEISLTITRGGATYYADSVSLARMRRTAAELTSWLTRAMRFPHGVVLLTGTSIVPDSAVTLAEGDEVAITATGLGALINTVGVLSA